tara:strand:+ start:7284 stop:7562 length:279 start_codon:yes stop_codon:yes gene_type:complete
MKEYDSNIYRLCVVVARKCISDKDSLSIEARDLLSQMIYDKGDIKKIDFSQLNWENTLIDYSDWVDYYNISEHRFGNILQILKNKVFSYLKE